MKFAIEVPVKTQNEMNVSRPGAWRARFGRAKRARTAVSRLFPKWKVEPLVRVTLTRFSPNEMDGDGLQAALKPVRDEVAACMNVDDRTRLVEWVYRQGKGERGKPMVRIEVEAMTPGAEEMRRKLEAALTAIGAKEDA